MSVFDYFKKEVRKELPKAEEWVIKYAANVRLRSWIEQNFTEKDLNMAFKNYMNVGNNYAAFTEDEVMFNNNTQSPIILNVNMPEEVGYHPDIQKMVEADTAAFYEAVKSTVGEFVNGGVQKVMMVVRFGKQLTAII
jgi:hypothetical protein